MTEVDYDYLIIGQGLAGTSIAFHLLNLGKRFLIVGDSSLPSSSKVAAGIFNPLTGKKLVKTWLADDLFPYARKFYSDLETKLDTRFLHEVSIYRPFRSIEEQNTYLAQSADPVIAPYVSANPDLVDVSVYIRAAYGGLEVVQSGWVDLPVLLEKSKTYFSDKGQFKDEKFESNDLQIEKDHIVWKQLKFSNVIFCQGFMALENRFFDWLPFAPVKGQILDIVTEKPIKQYIINQGIFMLPISEFVMRIGATYSWDPLDWNATSEATDELNAKLKLLIKSQYSVESAMAGIRPSVQDRRPLIGVHPEYGNVSIFNGLGTKGVTLAPFFANELVQHLETGKELNSLVNINRYYSLYFR
ncbi:NAD(P)/FAD-dependent oxidoreductase [Dyadobacter arcticus]|uniref:Glycine/D-amino acid oxidase-like deaminating enzyme n=1 Tax=Dyadobacter arcticus TaxID=1078754 RepID=A0ABX0USF1_9BACT|nr:FAD-binding oxidoreductase [Dyadobacter arcticus]NIJ54864.1 glycine/D-amino acid oxidase-like deaminating enzyme [Dyadobacter arcticus]